MPAKKKQASLEKTKSTTTYGKGGAKKKMYGGGAAKPMKKRVYKKGGLKKAQPGDVVGKAAQALGTGGGGMYNAALKALGLGKGKGAAGAGAKAFTKFTKGASKLGKAALLADPDKFPPIPPPILSAPTIPVTNIKEASDAAGKDVSGTIVDNFGKGGSVINGKSLRGTRSYKR